MTATSASTGLRRSAAPPPDNLDGARRFALAVLDQCRTFLRGVAQDVYARPSTALLRSTIGQHARHEFDHFRAALDGAPARDIDYDHRVRGGAEETDPAEALRAIDQLSAALEALPESALDTQVCVTVMLTGAGETARLETTLARELAFAAHHAVHHHAMMSAIAQEHGLAVAPGFGKAPSTMQHEGEMPQ